MLKTHLKSTALLAGIIVICALAASATLFCAAILNWSLTYAVLGLLICALVYLLYRFNERRIEEVVHAEAERRQHAEEMATIHMNTIESLAIAIDAKDQTTHGHVRRTQILTPSP